MRKPHEETLAFYDALIKSYKPKGPNNESMKYSFKEILSVPVIT